MIFTLFVARVAVLSGWFLANLAEKKKLGNKCGLLLLVPHFSVGVQIVQCNRVASDLLGTCSQPNPVIQKVPMQEQ
jgi:hypothetical protein